MIEKTRELLAGIARDLLARGLTDGTSGNISILDKPSQLVAVTPSGLPYLDMTADQITVLDLAGKVVWGKCPPTSEYLMHLGALKSREDITAVIHTHSRFAIAMASVHLALPSITVDMAAYCGKEAPVIPYQTPGTENLASHVADYVQQGFRAMLLANHGTLFVAPEADLLIDGAEVLELAAMAYIRGSVLGKPQPIREEEVNKLLDLVYGQKRAV